MHITFPFYTVMLAERRCCCFVFLLQWNSDVPSDVLEVSRKTFVVWSHFQSFPLHILNSPYSPFFSWTHTARGAFPFRRQARTFFWNVLFFPPLLPVSQCIYDIANAKRFFVYETCFRHIAGREDSTRRVPSSWMFSFIIHIIIASLFLKWCTYYFEWQTVLRTKGIWCVKQTVSHYCRVLVFPAWTAV